MTPVRWTIGDRVRFVAGYGLAKLTLPFRTSRPRFALFLFEVRYSLTNLINSLRPNTLAGAAYRGPGKLLTEGYRFDLRPGTHDAAILSPAFERADVVHLRRLIKTVATRRPEVWFIDVGANVGAFTVRVAKDFTTARVFACEAARENLNALARHVALNQLTNVTVLAGAALDRAGRTTLHYDADRPGDSHLRTGDSARGGTFETVETFRLDDRLPPVPAGLGVVIKADVEGFEAAALRGLSRVIASAAEVHLMVEDMMDAPDLPAALAELDFAFVTKRTPYNSWWMRRTSAT